MATGRVAKGREVVQGRGGRLGRPVRLVTPVSQIVPILAYFGLLVRTDENVVTCSTTRGKRENQVG